jgi:hypothetical protein
MKVKNTLSGYKMNMDNSEYQKIISQSFAKTNEQSNYISTIYEGIDRV